MPTDATLQTTPVGQHEHGLPEASRVDARSLGWIAAVVLLFLCLSVAALHVIYSYEVPVKTVPSPQAFPQPRVQTDEHAELERLLARQRQELSGYHWANADHTLVQIPIERAMQIIAQKGTQAYDPVASIPGALASPGAGPERALTPSAGGAAQAPP